MGDDYAIRDSWGILIDPFMAPPLMDEFPITNSLQWENRPIQGQEQSIRDVTEAGNSNEYLLKRLHAILNCQLFFHSKPTNLPGNQIKKISDFL